MIKFDVDMVQRIKVCGLFFLQSYKIITGTMLSLFIPQNCDGQICTLQQNLENNERYHQISLSWNTMTMISFIALYIYELKRENWSIKYLDIDNDKPDNELKQVIIKHEKLDKHMDSLNLRYYNIVKVNLFMNFVNIGIVIKILNNNYHSQSTISCFISFTLLILMKLYNSFNVAYQSVKHDKMMSAYMSEFVSFNVLDKDYIETLDITKKDDKDNTDDTRPEDIIPIVNNE
uniref:Uncharacterized protein n=1 Tax=viral metagenome TaxID=1070528 RepID=A0A6C0CYI5_9ZZZZ